MELNKTVWILWLQGWENAPWLQQQVANSWELNNPGWTIIRVSLENLKEYTTDIDYIYDSSKDITVQAKSDIIRLSLLNKHGGIWADSTVLCMQPLDPWVYDAVKPGGLWMYHGCGAEMSRDIGPCSWFIVSLQGSYLIKQWKMLCDKYWNEMNHAHWYFWMDALFKHLVENDAKFKEIWLKVPYLYCNLDGQSHTLFHHGIHMNTPYIKNILLEKPPYVLKLWDHWNTIFPDRSVKQCQESNGFYALELSKRKKTYIHSMVNDQIYL